LLWTTGDDGSSLSAVVLDLRPLPLSPPPKWLKPELGCAKDSDDGGGLGKDGLKEKEVEESGGRGKGP